MIKKAFIFQHSLLCSKFHVGSWVEHVTPEEGRNTHQPKHYEDNNKDEDNSCNTLNDKKIICFIVTAPKSVVNIKSHKFNDIVNSKFKKKRLYDNNISSWRHSDAPKIVYLYELISDVLLWTPAYGQAKAGRPAQTYLQQLCEDMGCSPEDLPEAMNDREKWQERIRDIRASGTTWWWYIYNLFEKYQDKWTIIIPLAFNRFIPVSLPLVKAPLKLFFRYGMKLYYYISFNVPYIFKYPWDEFWI